MFEKVELISTSSKILIREGLIMEENGPSIQEVLDYTKKMILFFIAKKAKHLPYEQKEEIQQIAYLKLIEKFPEIRSEGWKSLIYQKCNGIVLDYLKLGTGFEDDTDNHRVELVNSDGDDVSVDQVAGIYGVSSPELQKVNINWDLLSKLASRDLPLRAFSKQLLGIPLKTIGPNLDVEIARADQLVKEFISRFDDPEFADCAWFKQCCYALGISELLGLPNEPIYLDDADYMIGENLDPVNLYDEEPSFNYKMKTAQLGFNIDG